MNVIIYGPEPPKISFTQSPDGAITFRIDNERVLDFKENQENITWRHLFPKRFLLRDGTDDLTRTFKKFVEELADLTHTPAERKFFLDYTSKCIEFGSHFAKTAWDYPALIPQVWVNWIHYDPTDARRAERAQREPFRVDFAMKAEHIGPNLAVFEIDGASHFRDIEAYTRHLRKDRWLRKQGWEVFRISNLEVGEYEDFYEFYLDVTEREFYVPVGYP